jgi:hypothetical protein
MRRWLMLGLVTVAGAAALIPGAAGGSVAGPAISNHPRVASAPSNTQGSGWSSSNWSGYAKTGTYTSATAQWVVPTVTAARQASYSSSWVGIDGFTNSSLIQTGTEQDWSNGAAHYHAWWEILPAAETRISSITVHPGDVFTASITKGSGSSWTITINDVSTGQGFTTVQSYSGPGTSVEWIQEAPTVGGHTAPLAHFSTTSFDPGTANGANPGLTAADAGVMVQKHVTVSTPSAPDADTDGFNVAYGSTAPAPPSS